MKHRFIHSTQKIALKLSKDCMENDRGKGCETNAVIVRGHRKYLLKFQDTFVLSY